MKMTRQEVNKKTDEKVSTIKVLCEQLKIQLSAKQAITNQGFIENIVYFLDTEKYEIEENKPNEELKKDEKITDIRKKNGKVSA
jgi:hypothetical protein